MFDIIKKIDPEDLKAQAARSWAVSWPMVLIMFFEFLISLTDVYIAGLLGKEFQAAVGFTSQVYFIFIVVGNALTMGAVSVISRLFSSEERIEYSNALYTVSVTAVAAGAFIGISGWLFSSMIISGLSLPDIVKHYAIPLVKIYAPGLFFHYYLIVSNGILRASNSVKKSMRTMAFACVANIAMNYIFVFYTPLGFRGIALSTVLSVGLAALLNLGHIKKLLTEKHTYSIPLIRRIISIGWPSGLLQIAWQIGSTVLFLIISALPENRVEVLAAFTNGIRIESAIFLPAFAFSMSNAVIVGNCLGKKREDDAFKEGMITGVTGVIIIFILTVIVILNAGRLAGFLSDDPVVIDEIVRYLYISMISEPFMAWAVILGGGLNGSGDTKSVMRIVGLSLWCVRLPLSYFLGIYMGFGAPGIWWSMNSSIFVHMIFISRRYLGRRWMRHEDRAA